MALDGFGVTFSANTWCENEGKPMMFMWMATNNWRLGNLYFQALFYMFIFRHKQLLELEEGELYDNVNCKNLNVLAILQELKLFSRFLD